MENGNKLTEMQNKLIKRRRLHLFTFYSQAALHAHIRKLRVKFPGIKNIDKFIVHNIRTLRLINIYEAKGLKAAQEFAGHTSEITTL